MPPETRAPWLLASTLVFRAAVPGAIIWFGLAVVMLAVGCGCHPMSFHGHVAGPWIGAFALLAAADAVLTMIRLWRAKGGARRRVVIGGGLGLCAAVHAHGASMFIETDCRRWARPRDPLAMLALQRVRDALRRLFSGEGHAGRCHAARYFTPRHDASGAATITVMKSIKAPDASADGACKVDACNFKCKEARGRYVHAISGRASALPADPAAALTRAQDLLDSFDVAR